jgi:nucleoid-associated protein YgaU
VQGQSDYSNANEAPRYNNASTSAPYRDPRAAATDAQFGASAGAAAQYEGPQDDPRNVDHPYRVVYGDSYWSISKRLYNTGEYHQALEAHNRNRIATASQLKPGRVISAPAAADLDRLYPKLVPQRGTANVVTGRDGSRQYVVQEGDTLYDIARFQLGRAARWVEVYDLNRDQLGDSFDSLTPGMRLRLPEATPPRGPVTNAARTPIR